MRESDERSWQIRKAGKEDSRRLYEIRRTAINLLATSGMSSDQARRWADARTPGWFDEVIQQRDVWVLESAGLVLGWVSATNSEIDGLYTDPDHAKTGIGSKLLGFAEEQLRQRGFSEIRCEASWNAEEFYAHRGWEPTGPRPPDGARPFKKRLA